MAKKYRDEYADHCIRHPHDHVSYIAFRQRCRTWGPKLAIRLGKRQSAVKMGEIIEEKIKSHKKTKETKNTIKTIAIVLAGAVLLLIGMLVGIAM